MGKRGPAPAPTHLKLLRGERNKDRINPNEPKARAGTMPEPVGMAEPVRAIWETVTAELTAMGLAFPADVDTLRVYVEAVHVHREASKLVHRDGTTVVNPKTGATVRNPAAMIQRDAGNTIRVMGHEFGLSPSSRSSIRAAEEGHDDPDDPFAPAPS